MYNNNLLDVSKKDRKSEEQRSILWISQSHKILWQHRFNDRSQQFSSDGNPSLVVCEGPGETVTEHGRGIKGGNSSGDHSTQ